MCFCLRMILKRKISTVLTSSTDDGDKNKLKANISLHTVALYSLYSWRQRLVCMDGHSRQQRSAGRWCYSPRTPQGWGGRVGTGCSAGPPQAESPESFPGSVQLPAREKRTNQCKQKKPYGNC